MAPGLRAAAIASVIAIVASTSVMAQTTGTIPPPGPPPQFPPPPTANQYSSNEIIDAGHRFFGSVSHGLAEVVEKAVSQWGLPNGYILGEEARAVLLSAACVMATARFIPEMLVTFACSGKDRASGLTSELMAHGR